MNDNIKRYIYTFGAVFIVFLLGVVIFKILPIIILAGVIVYAIAKFVGYIKAKKEQENLPKSHSKDSNMNNDYYYNRSADDYTTGEIIDVDYEEVKKK